jgi:hypothetical protein
MAAIVCALVGVAIGLSALPSYSQPDARRDDPTDAPPRTKAGSAPGMNMANAPRVANGLILMGSRLLTVRCRSELASKSKDGTVAAPSL